MEHRRARWSRDPSQLRHGRIGQLEKALDNAHALDDEEEEAPASPSAEPVLRKVHLPRDSETASSWRDSTYSYVDDVVVEEPIELSGFLHKRSGVFSALNRRFFVLNEGTLLWYKSEHDATPAGYCHLCEARSITQHPPPPAEGGRGGSSLNSSSRLGSGRSTEEGEPSSPASPASSSKRATSAASSVVSKGETSSAALCIRAGKDYMLHADDSSERDKWLRALLHNRGYPPARPFFFRWHHVAIPSSPSLGDTWQVPTPRGPRAT